MLGASTRQEHSGSTLLQAEAPERNSWEVRGSSFGSVGYRLTFHCHEKDKTNLYSWWLNQPISKIFRQNGPNRGENKEYQKIFEPEMIMRLVEFRFNFCWVQEC